MLFLQFYKSIIGQKKKISARRLIHFIPVLKKQLENNPVFGVVDNTII